MSESLGYKEVFFGISSYKCNNKRLFDYIEDNQKSGETVLQFRSRKDGDGEELFIGLPVEVNADGSVNMLSLMLVKNMLDDNEHAKIANIQPKLYFL